MPYPRTQGGLSHTPEYKVWAEMVRRCSNPNHKRYGEWGGRGIKVCDDWLDFVSFLRDMGNRPGVGYSIERRDNDEGYNKENCYWATAEDQNNNTKRNRMMTLNGVTQSMSKWAKALGLNYNTVRSRVYILGWSDVDALSVTKR